MKLILSSSRSLGKLKFVGYSSLLSLFFFFEGVRLETIFQIIAPIIIDIIIRNGMGEIPRSRQIIKRNIIIPPNPIMHNIKAKLTE